MKTDFVLIDAASLHEATKVLSSTFQDEKVKTVIDYSKLHTVLEDFKQQKGFPLTGDTLFFVSVDPNSVGQEKFIEAITNSTEFCIDVVHHKIAEFSLPPGISLRWPMMDFSARMAYIIGRLSLQSSGSILLVTHSFNLYPFLAPLSERFKVGLAYWEKLLDFRWRGLIRQGLPWLNFCNFDTVDIIQGSYEAAIPEQMGDINKLL